VIGFVLVSERSFFEAVHKTESIRSSSDSTFFLKMISSYDNSSALDQCFVEDSGLLLLFSFDLDYLENL